MHEQNTLPADILPSFTEVKTKISLYINEEFNKIDLKTINCADLANILMKFIELPDSRRFFVIDSSTSSIQATILDFFKKMFSTLNSILKCSHLDLANEIFSGQIIYAIKSTLLSFLEKHQISFSIQQNEIQKLKTIYLLEFATYPILDNEVGFIISKDGESWHLKALYPGIIKQETEEVFFSPRIKQVLSARAHFNTRIKPIFEKFFQSCAKTVTITTPKEESFIDIDLYDIDLSKLEALVTFDFMESLYSIYKNLSPYPRLLKDCFRYDYPFSCVVMLTAEEAAFFDNAQQLLEDLDYEYDFSNNVEPYLRVELTSLQQLEVFKSIENKLANRATVDTLIESRSNLNSSSKEINSGIALQLAGKLLLIPQVITLFSKTPERAKLYKYLKKFHVDQNFDTDEFITAIKNHFQTQKLENREEFLILIASVFQASSSSIPRNLKLM